MLMGDLRRQEKKLLELSKVCQNCTRNPQEAGQLLFRSYCSSLDCTVYFERCRTAHIVEDIEDLCKGVFEGD